MRAVHAPRRPDAVVGPGAGVPPPAALRRRPARPSLARLLVMGADAGAVTAAMAAAFLLRSSLPLGRVGVGAGAYERVGVLALPLWLTVFHHNRLYCARHVASRRAELGRVVRAVAGSVLLTAVLAYALDRIVARSWVVLLLPVATATVLVERELVRQAFAALRRRGWCLRPVVVVGAGSEGLALASMLEEKPQLGYRVVALAGDTDRVDLRGLERWPILDPRLKVAEQVRMAGADGVIVATPDVEAALTNRLVRSLTDAGLHVELSCSLRDIDASRLSVRALGRFPVLHLQPVRRDGWRSAAKRTFDVVVAAAGLVVCLPLLAAVALAIKVTSPGPVLFRQERVGHMGRRFRILKLRSMYVDADERLEDLEPGLAGGPVVKIPQDPRVTPVGRVLRRLSIDELPQLVNVLRGEMSLVGPRPEQPSEVVLWSPDVFDRLRVRPGVTGMWQVSGRSEARSAKDRWDLYYVDNWSMWRDVAILFRTVPAVLSQRGAY